jgi:hypothetical protein
MSSDLKRSTGGLSKARQAKTILDTANDPQLATEQPMRSIKGSVILHNYCERIVAKLDAL